MILVFRQQPKHHRSLSNICLLLSIRPDQGVDLSHVSVVEQLHILFHVVLVGLDIHSEPR